MKKLLLSVAAVATLAAAAPAMAQPFNPGGYGGGYDGAYGRGNDVDYGRGYDNINQREREISWRIARGQRDVHGGVVARLVWRIVRLSPRDE